MIEVHFFFPKVLRRVEKGILGREWSTGWLDWDGLMCDWWDDLKGMM